MRKQFRQSFLICLIQVIACNMSSSVIACAPISPCAIPVNPNHPDLPLKKFAAGSLGVIQPSWAMSYLIVSYRYLNNVPLTAIEQKSVLRLWHNRWQAMDFLGREDGILEFLALRNKALGTRSKTVPDYWSAGDSYASQEKIQPDAFDVALKTLKARIKRYGLKSLPVKEWLSAQDMVFGINSRYSSIPPPISGRFDKTLRDDRDYQIAAAHFYTGDVVTARKEFAKIAQDKDSQWSRLSAYLAVRAAVADDKLSVEQKKVFVEAAMKDEKDFERRQDLVDLLGMCINKEKSPAEIVGRAAKSVTKSGSEQFGRELGDLTFSLDVLPANSPIALVTPPEGPAVDRGVNSRHVVKSESLKNDVVDWVDTMQCPYDECDFSMERDQNIDQMDENEKKFWLIRQARLQHKAAHSVEQWHKTKSQAWLVALMCWNGLRSSKLRDAFAAASKMPSTSAAYLTSSFFVIDALIAQHKESEATKRLTSLLARFDLPPSARNLFQLQLMAATTGINQYLNAVVLRLPCVTEADDLVPFDWMQEEASDLYHIDGSAVDELTARDLNYNLPLSFWVVLAQKHAISRDLRRVIVAAAWLRAQLVNRPDIAELLSGDLASVYPTCAASLKSYQLATDSREKRYALAKFVLHNCGMCPYVYSGVPRMGARFDEHNMYQLNFWLPLAPSKALGKSETKEDICAPAPRDPAEKYVGCEVSYRYPVVLKIMNDYSKRSVKRLLTKEQNAQAANERELIWQNHPSKFLGEPVLEWAKYHPDDPDLPEMLYRVVKLPWWSGESKTGSKYSRAAFKLLKSKYAHSRWAAKAICWY